MPLPEILRESDRLDKEAKAIKKDCFKTLLVYERSFLFRSDEYELGRTRNYWRDYNRKFRNYKENRPKLFLKFVINFL